MGLSRLWVIEASESPLSKPHFLHGITRGSCYFLWSDDYDDAKKFESAHEAAQWAATNRLNCGFRVCEKKYSSNFIK